MRRFGDGGELVVNVRIGTIVVNVRFVDSGELINLGSWYLRASSNRMSATPSDAREGQQVNGVWAGLC
jgi:hypothetical protein